MDEYDFAFLKEKLEHQLILQANKIKHLEIALREANGRIAELTIELNRRP